MSEKLAMHSPNQRDSTWHCWNGRGAANSPLPSLPLFPQVSSDAITDFVFVIAVAAAAAVVVVSA